MMGLTRSAVVSGRAALAIMALVMAGAFASVAVILLALLGAL